MLGVTRDFPKVSLHENLGVPCEFNGPICSLYFYVYQYTDPKNGKIIYVGKGTSYRAWSHLNKSSNQKLGNLIRSRQASGYLIRPSILKFFDTSEDALKCEKILIAKIGREDLGKGTLFNLDNGGTEGTDAGKKIEFRGEKYGSMRSLCRSFKVNEDVFRGRLSLGWSIDQALNLETKENLHGAVTIEVGDKKWLSITAFAEEIGASPSRIKYYLKNGVLPEDLIGRDFSKRHGNEVFLGDKLFPSVVEFANYCKKSIKAVSYWMETGWTPEEIFEGLVINRSAIYTTWNGAAITQTEFAKICNISHGTLIKYRKKNLSNDEIFQLGKRSLSEKYNGISISYEGMIYQTLSSFNNAKLKVALSTVSKWFNHFELSAEETVKIVNLANQIAYSQDISYQGCLAQASSIVRGKRPLLRVGEMVVTQVILRSLAGVGDVTLRHKINKGLNGDEILEWAENNRGKSTKIDPTHYQGHIFKTYASLDRYFDCPDGYVAKCQRWDLNVTETRNLIASAKEKIDRGISQRSAYLTSSREFMQSRKGGKKLSLKVAKYIELRRHGIDPKKSCEKSGMSKSNSSRLEKTHKNLIENKQISLLT